MDSACVHPHCDPQVLHAPGVCEYCDHYPERQASRIETKTLFTGELAKDGWTACPADRRRPPSGDAWHGNWHGNVATPFERSDEWQRSQGALASQNLLGLIKELES